MCYIWLLWISLLCFVQNHIFYLESICAWWVYMHNGNLRACKKTCFGGELLFTFKYYIQVYTEWFYYYITLISSNNFLLTKFCLNFSLKYYIIFNEKSNFHLIKKSCFFLYTYVIFKFFCFLKWKLVLKKLKKEF